MPKKYKVHLEDTTYCNKVAPWKRDAAKKFRANPTPAEGRLWEHLKGKQLGYRIHRQKIILGYIADFYSPFHKLVIECDGPIHDQQKDKERDAVLRANGFRTIRFTNNEVLNDIDSVIGLIRDIMQNRKWWILRQSRDNYF